MGKNRKCAFRRCMHGSRLYRPTLTTTLTGGPAGIIGGISSRPTLKRPMTGRSQTLAAGMKHPRAPTPRTSTRTTSGTGSTAGTRAFVEYGALLVMDQFGNVRTVGPFTTLDADGINPWEDVPDVAFSGYDAFNSLRPGDVVVGWMHTHQYSWAPSIADSIVLGQIATRLASGYFHQVSSATISQDAVTFIIDILGVVREFTAQELARTNADLSQTPPGRIIGGSGGLARGCNGE